MKLSRASVYAIYALIRFVGADGPTPSHKVVEGAGNIPERFLTKVLHPLVRAGILTSLQGPHGGYRLAKAPKDISLLDIIEASDGPIRKDIPALGLEVSTGAEKQLQAVYDRIAEDTRARLAKVKLTDLAAKKSK